MLRFAAAAALSFALSVPAAAQSDLDPAALPDWDVVLVAHRGLAPGLPENTMAAFEDVIARGVGVIEIDLRGTRDGEVVVMHDETVDRTTDGTGTVTEMTLAEIRALDAGIYAGDAYAGQQVPTFEEVLKLAKASGTVLLLDIKLSDTLDRKRIVRLVEQNGALLNVIAGVRSLDDLAEIRGLNPNIRTLGFIPNPGAVEEFAAAGVEIIRLWPQWIAGEPRKEGEVMPADCEGVENCLVNKVHALNRPVWSTAGAAGREELTGLIEAGVNGILTDVPDVMATLLSDIEAMKAPAN
ncbi:MAG: glycerophosphodiester phosphodiesterase family protein [Rhodobacteraceae bacterium]|nr:glycerophosphodiester phosphodiesterase family protein [Paracoccaceae bacterium]